MRAFPLLVLTVSLLVAAPAQAARPSAVENAANTLLSNAEVKMFAKDKTCFGSDRPVFAKAPVIAGQPDAALLKLFSPLRRAQTDEERALLPATDRDRFLSPVGASGVYGGASRIMQAADGSRLVITIGKTDPAIYGKNLKACLALRRGFLTALARKSRRAVRKRAFELERSTAADKTSPPPNTISIGTYNPGGPGGGSSGPIRVSDLAKTGYFGSTGAALNLDESNVHGLVPDGVASITYTFGASLSRGPGAPRKQYPSEVVITTAVQQNVFSFVAPRRAEDARPKLTVWKRADGSIMRTIADPTV